MDESSARDVLAVKAIETSDRARSVWGDADRAWATRAAAEVVTAGGSDASFVARRARLALERLREREASLVQAIGALHWRPWITPLVLAVGFVLGIAGDRIGGTGWVNILAPPLLGVLLWNMGVYAVLLARGLRAGRPRPREGIIRRAIRTLAATHRPERALRGGGLAAATFGSFAMDWSRLVGPLYALRTARLLHLAAATLALGALTGMYARGLVFEYRAAWESTFLGAPEVHRLVSFVLAPAARLTGLAIPSVEHIAGLRAAAGATAGENAAMWLHLYAVTIAMVVIVPRACLALVADLALRRARARLALPTDDGYFRRLVRSFREGPLRVRVVPYSLSPSPLALQSLEALFERAFGRCELSVAPTAPYGTDAVPDGGGAGVNVAAALFAITATPEPETHGRFVAELAAQENGRDCLALVDESSFRERWPRDEARLAERRSAWQGVLTTQVPVLFLHLAKLDLDRAGAAVEQALERTRP
ncbi:MAG: DUF2868 domain-containing protein [Casimicrobiaceae bacterium]